MAERRALIVEDEVLISVEFGAIVQKALDAEVLMSRSVARAKQLINQPVDLALLDVDVTNGKTFEAAMLLALLWHIFEGLGAFGIDRDRGTPCDAAPPTPPGIRVRTTAVRSG
jgi:hypothetical protein